MSTSFSAWAKGITGVFSRGQENTNSESNSIMQSDPYTNDFNFQQNVNQPIPMQHRMSMNYNPYLNQMPQGSTTLVSSHNGIISGQQGSIPNFPVNSNIPTAMTVVAGVRTLVPVVDIGDVQVTYFDLPKLTGFGGPIRFFLLGKHIKHRFINLKLGKDDWPEIKKNYLETNENPSGKVPFMKHLNKYNIYETIAILRYLARKIGEYGMDPFRDAVVDMISYKMSDWTSDIMKPYFQCLLGDVLEYEERNDKSYEEDHGITSDLIISLLKTDTKKVDDTLFKDYLAKRKENYENTEKLLAVYNFNPFLPIKGDLCAPIIVNAGNSQMPSNSSTIPAHTNYCSIPSFAEFLIFRVLYDEMKLVELGSKFCTTDDLKDLASLDLIKNYPVLSRLYDKIMELPLIAQWNREIGSSNGKTNSCHDGNIPVQTNVSNPTEDIPFDKLNQPQSTNIYTYRLAPPLNQVIFPAFSNGSKPYVEQTNHWQQNNAQNNQSVTAPTGRPHHQYSSNPYKEMSSTGFLNGTPRAIPQIYQQSQQMAPRASTPFNYPPPYQVHYPYNYQRSY